jgi:Zn-dependent metalloprotease
MMKSQGLSLVSRLPGGPRDDRPAREARRAGRGWPGGIAAFIGILLVGGMGRSSAAPVCGGAFPATADAMIREDSPDVPLGGEPELQVNLADGREVRTLLSFNLDERIQAGAAIHSAVLEVTMVRARPAPYAMEFRPLLKRWDEASVTWLTQPPSGATLATIHSHLEADAVAFDVTDQVAAWLANGNRQPSLLLRPAVSMETTFLSREADDPPRLVIACAPPVTDPPIDGTLRDAAQQAGLDLLRSASSISVKIRFERGAVRFADFRLRAPAPFDTDNLTRAKWFLSERRDLLRLSDPDSELQLARRSADGEHLFFRQIHAGIPVFPAEIGVHLDEGKLIGLGGNYVPDITTPSQPRIDGGRAVAIAVGERVGAAAPAGDVLLRYVSPGLLGGTDPRTYLAWQVTLSDGAGGSQVFVDALGGGIVHVRALTRTAYDLSLNTGGGAPPLGGIPNICWFPTGADVEWFDEYGQRPNTTPSAEGIDAFANIRTIYDYWRNALGRDSWNGSGAQIALYVHVNLPGNAHWVPFCNIFEFGNGMSVLDVMGHEFTHGVTAHEAGLQYRNQSGALDESYADLFGFLAAPQNWTLGETASFPAQFIRTLNDPPAGCGTATTACDPDHMQAAFSGDGQGLRPACTSCTEANDFGGVHVNSGIMNKAGSLIIAGGIHNGFSVGGIGRQRAAVLFRNVLANRLTGNAQFVDARDQSVAEAALNFGDWVRCQVQNAYASVGQGQGDADCDGTDDSFEPDDDADGVPDIADNCGGIANAGQTDIDGDGDGDACDPDDDADGVPDAQDDCPRVWDAPQTDTDGDGIGDVCDDGDLDGVIDMLDNCPFTFNPDQKNWDWDWWGDVCDPDADGDGVDDASDNCLRTFNPSQVNRDGDARGDACDNCPLDAGVSADDWEDPDKDGLGNLCDPDDDGDGVLDPDDNCPRKYNPGQENFDFDGDGLVCDGFELREFYENINFWDIPRYVKWLPDLPVEIPVRVCPGCPGPLLPKGFTTLIDIQMPTDFGVRLVNADGLGLGAIDGPAGFHRVRLDPAPYGISRFDFEGILSAEDASSASGPFPEIVAPSQTRYALELYPSPDTDVGVPWEISIQYHECADADGDGAHTPADPVCLTLGPADCDDASAARFPGNPEICDGVDNDCDGLPDGFVTACGAGACSRTGICTAGVDTCAAGGPSPEVCDGVDNDCDGLADNTALPGALSGVTMQQDELQWPPVPLASAYDVVRGDLDTMRASGGDLAAATTSCLGHDQAPTSISDPGVPFPPGQGFYYLVRAVNCGGPGTYDTSSSQQQGSRDVAIAASPYQCADCPHDACFPAGPLSSGCGACEAAIIAVDPYCGSVAWDSICVAEVRTICGSLRCWESQGSCAHTLCTTGAPLAAGCDSPPSFPSCAGAICSADPYCCATAWDDTCTSEVATICGKNCG